MVEYPKHITMLFMPRSTCGYMLQILTPYAPQIHTYSMTHMPSTSHDSVSRIGNFQILFISDNYE